MRLVLPKWRITMSNVVLATTLVLMREQANTARTSYKRKWKVLLNATPAKFMWKFPEGTGDAVESQERLLAYIEYHLPLIERYADRIRLSDQALTRCNNANRSGGSRHRSWEDVNQAIEQESRRRQAAFAEEQYTEKGSSAVITSIVSLCNMQVIASKSRNNAWMKIWVFLSQPRRSSWRPL